MFGQALNLIIRLDANPRFAMLATLGGALLPIFFQLDGVLYSMPVSDVLTFVISCVAIVFTYRSLLSQKAPAPFID